LITLLKYYVRTQGDIGLEGFHNFTELDLFGIYEIYLGAFRSLFQRLQHFSSVAALWDNIDLMRNGIESGFVRPYYLDGPFGLAILRIFGIPDGYELNTALISTLLGTDPTESSYATHIGILGWLIVGFEHTPFYLIYLAILMFLSVTLVRYSQSEGIRELNWLTWIILLMHGWFGAFTSYLVAGYIFVYIRRHLR
jgi:hypothetical protein